MHEDEQEDYRFIDAVWAKTPTVFKWLSIGVIAWLGFGLVRMH